MKREILFQYLVDCQVVFKVSADKKELIQEILRYWGVAAVDLQDVGFDYFSYQTAEYQRTC